MQSTISLCFTTHWHFSMPSVAKFLARMDILSSTRLVSLLNRPFKVHLMVLWYLPAIVLFFWYTATLSIQPTSDTYGSLIWSNLPFDWVQLSIQSSNLLHQKSYRPSKTLNWLVSQHHMLGSLFPLIASFFETSKYLSTTIYWSTSSGRKIALFSTLICNFVSMPIILDVLILRLLYMYTSLLCRHCRVENKKTFPKASPRLSAITLWGSLGLSKPKSIWNYWFL